MKLKLTNNQLQPVTTFLKNINLPGAQANIARVRIVNLLTAKNNEFIEDQREVVKQYANLDEQGEPVIKDNGTFDVPTDKIPEANVEIAKLTKAPAVIELSEYEDKAVLLQETLENLTDTLNGDQANSLVAFLDGLTQTSEKEGK